MRLSTEGQPTTYYVLPTACLLGRSRLTEIQRLPASPSRMHTAPSSTSEDGRLVPSAQRRTVKKWWAWMPGRS